MHWRHMGLWQLMLSQLTHKFWQAQGMVRALPYATSRQHSAIYCVMKLALNCDNLTFSFWDPYIVASSLLLVPLCYGGKILAPFLWPVRISTLAFSARQNLSQSLRCSEHRAVVGMVGYSYGYDVHPDWPLAEIQSILPSNELVYNRTLFSIPTPEYDLSSWTPQVPLICLIHTLIVPLVADLLSLQLLRQLAVTIICTQILRKLRYAWIRSKSSAVWRQMQWLIVFGQDLMPDSITSGQRCPGVPVVCLKERPNLSEYCHNRLSCYPTSYVLAHMGLGAFLFIFRHLEANLYHPVPAGLHAELQRSLRPNIADRRHVFGFLLAPSDITMDCLFCPWLILQYDLLPCR